MNFEKFTSKLLQVSRNTHLHFKHNNHKLTFKTFIVYTCTFPNYPEQIKNIIEIEIIDGFSSSN